MHEWSDLRLFLGVAREGSTLAAARTLGVNQTTVARRIAALEQQLGLQLFDRSPRGYVLTRHGTALLAHAEAVEAATLRLQSEAARLARDLTGSIRVTATHPIMRHLVGPVIAAYRAIHPEVTFEILSAARHLSLEDGEADLAFRSAKALTGDTLVATRLPDITASVYCSDAYFARHGAPETPAAIAAHDVVVYAGTPGMEMITAWLTAHAAADRVVGSVGAPEDMVSVLLAGTGVRASLFSRRCDARPPALLRSAPRSRSVLVGRHVPRGPRPPARPQLHGLRRRAHPAGEHRCSPALAPLKNLRCSPSLRPARPSLPPALVG